MHHYLLLFLQLWIGLQSARAQAPVMTTKIVTVALAPISGQFHYLSAGEVKSFSIGMNGLDEAFTYEGSPTLTIHRSAQGFEPTEEGRAGIQPVATISIPEKADRVLLVCAMDEDEQLNVISYDISSSKVKNGSYRFFNFSSKNLAFNLDNQRFSLKSGDNRTLHIQKWQEEILDIPLQIGVLTNDLHDAKLAYSTVWGHRPIRRHLVFLLNNPRSETGVQVRRFYDIVLP